MALTIEENILITLQAEFHDLHRSLGQAQAATHNATTHMRKDLHDMNTAAQLASNSINGMNRTLDRMGKNTQKTKKEMVKLNSTVNLIDRSLFHLTSIIVGAYGLRAMISVGKSVDTWNLVNDRIKLVVDSTAELRAKQEAVFAISQKTRTHYESTAALYARMARNAKSLNIESDRLLTVTEIISKALIISGASAQSADAALVQLTQGFAANALRGQELNSVMEQIPRVSEAIATGMGVSIGRLRDLAEDGKLTTESVISAIETQNKAVDKEFKAMARTMGQSIVQLQNSWKRFLGYLDKSVGITSMVTSKFDYLKNMLEDTDKVTKGYQNTMADTVRSFIANFTYMTDYVLMAYELAKETWGSIGPWFSLQYNTLLSRWSMMFDKAVWIVGKAYDEIKLKTLQLMHYLSSITVGGVQITPTFVDDKALREAMAAVAEWDILAAQSTLESRKEVEKLTKAYSALTLSLRSNSTSAIASSSVSVAQRIIDMKREAEAFSKLRGKVVRTPTIKDVGITKTERTRLEKIAKAQKGVNTSLLYTLRLRKNLLVLQSRELKGIEQAQLELRANVEMQYKRIQAATALKEQYEALLANANDKNTLEYTKEINDANNEILKAKIKLEELEQGWFESLEQSFKVIKASADEMRKQKDIQREIQKAQGNKVSNPYEYNINKAEEALKQAKDLVEAYKTLEDTESNKFKISQANTSVLTAQLDLVKAQKQQWKDITQIISTLASQGAEVFGDTGSLTAAVESIAQGALATARSGGYGAGGVAFAFASDVIRGIFNDSQASIEQAIENSRGTVDFDNKGLERLGSMYSDAIYPLLKLTEQTNKLLLSTASNTDGISRELSQAAIGATTPYGWDNRGGVQGQYIIQDLTGADFNADSYSRYLGLQSGSTSLEASGLTIQAQNLMDAIVDIHVNGYEVIREDSSAFWGIVHSTDITKEALDLNSKIVDYFTETYSNAYTMVKQAGESLGVVSSDLASALAKVRLEEINIEIKGLSKDEASQRIQEALGTSFDSIVDQVDLFSSLIDQFAKGSEGSFETLMRLAYEYEQASFLLGQVNIPLPEFGVVVGKEDEYKKWMDAAAAENSEFWRDVYLTLADTYKMSKQALVLELVEMAGGLDNLNQLTSDYMKDYFTAQEIALKQQEYIQGVLAEAGLELPDTKEAYRDMVEGIDLTTEEGRKLYLLLLQLAPTFADVVDELGKVEEAMKGLTYNTLTKLYKELSQANVKADLALGTLGINDVNVDGVLSDSFNLGVNMEAIFGAVADSVGSSALLDTLETEMGLDFDFIQSLLDKGIFVKSQSLINNIKTQLGVETLTVLDVLKAIQENNESTYSEVLKAVGANLDIEGLELTGDETASELNQKVDDYINKLYEALLGESAQFTQLVDLYAAESESALDTLIRLASEYSEASKTLFFLGHEAVSVNDTLALVQETGGISQFRSLTDAFLKNYYTEQEYIAKQAEVLQGQFAGLGVSMPTTISEYRKLMESQDLSTEAGRALYASLLQLSSAFYNVNKETEKAIDKSKEQIDSIRSNYDTAVKDAITGSFSLYTSAEQESKLRQMAYTDKQEGNLDDYLANLKTATQKAFEMSPTREAFEAKFNTYMDALATKKDKDINDIYAKMEDIQSAIETQSDIYEKSSYQADL